MVKVTVAVYVPVAYTGSSVRDHATDAEFPADTELALAPKVPTEVAVEVLAVCEPVQAVPGEATVQVYVSASPAVGGVVTDGPPVPAKSVVTFKVIVPVPPVLVVRIL